MIVFKPPHRIKNESGITFNREKGLISMDANPEHLSRKADPTATTLERGVRSIDFRAVQPPKKKASIVVT